ncbi:hypothetical protein HZH68_014020 [Vespula germanica]|uniref:Uncharacterized protein n=1 Tax=Vespula germanica TaxID=30212 RepID=A0A834MUF0_VESGE|nr:hypothetical protein HZH68_014020 [Vespula germanica]
MKDSHVGYGKESLSKKTALTSKTTTKTTTTKLRRRRRRINQQDDEDDEDDEDDDEDDEDDEDEDYDDENDDGFQEKATQSTGLEYSTVGVGPRPGKFEESTADDCRPSGGRMPACRRARRNHCLSPRTAGVGKARRFLGNSLLPCR